MTTYKKIPRAKGIDNTLRLKKEGYPFIPDRMKALHTNIFRTRLMGKRVICITGTEAARLFYDPDYFVRHRANPKRIQKTLFGVNAIQGMDGDAHLHRKQLFLHILSPKRIILLREIVRSKYMNSIPDWQKRGQIRLYDETAQLLCESVCEWCDISITPEEASLRSKQFLTMVYAIAQIGPNYRKGKAARKNTESWIESIIKEVRCGMRHPHKETALFQIATYRDYDGKPLSNRAAAIELINVIRPIVAITIYIVFAALALHDYPHYKKQLRVREEPFFDLFAEEVRRYYPLGPFLGARVKKDFIWQDYRFKKGTLVFLDAYGINSDPAIWKKPKEFYPENFKDRGHDLYAPIPQGGGDLATGHRCPGEVVTLDILKDVIDFLVNKIEYTVPVQDLSYSLREIPTLPESGFFMTHVKRKC